MTNMERIKELSTQIKGLEQDLHGLKVECEELVNAICEWMARTCKSSAIVGTISASIQVYADGTYKWYGVLSRWNLDAVEAAFIKRLEEEKFMLERLF